MHSYCPDKLNLPASEFTSRPGFYCITVGALVAFGKRETTANIVTYVPTTLLRLLQHNQLNTLGHLEQG